MSLKFDLSDFQRYARRMDALATQIPFALALSLNASAEIARQEIIEHTWPDNIEARNRSFIKATLDTRGERATKRRLRVIVFDRLGRVNLTLHDKGGTRQPRGGALAIPSADLQARRSGKGVPKGLRPRALPNSFVKGDAIYQRVGKGKSRGLKLMYVLRPQARIKPDVPFHASFDATMRRAMPIQFRLAMRKAMATARKVK